MHAMRERAAVVRSMQRERMAVQACVLIRGPCMHA